MHWLKSLVNFLKRSVGIRKPILPHKSMSDEQDVAYSPEIEKFVISNYKDRPDGVDGIILHSMGQYIGGKFAGQFLQDVGLSAHYLIEHTGKIFECVAPEKQAYHAGKSEFQGQEHLNTSFIGIELLVEGDHTYETFLEAIKRAESFTEQQYQSTIWLCNRLIDDYQIPTNRIVRHSDVSGPDVRPDPKKDPGSGFDYHRVISQMHHLG